MHRGFKMGRSRATGTGGLPWRLVLHRLLCATLQCAYCVVSEGDGTDIQTLACPPQVVRLECNLHASCLIVVTYQSPDLQEIPGLSEGGASASAGRNWVSTSVRLAPNSAKQPRMTED